MIRKITMIVVLVVFISFTFSCSTIKQVNLVKGESWNINSRITTVFTKSGDLFEFSNKNPARVKFGEIVGEAIDKTGNKKFVSIPLNEAKVIWISSEGVKVIKILLVPLALVGVYFTSWLLSAIQHGLFK